MKSYYCLIAGLRELAAEGERKGFDASQIITEIRAELSKPDTLSVNLLYTSVDIENIIAHRRGSERYNPLGTIAKEDLDLPLGLLEGVQKIVDGYSDRNEDEEFDASEQFERALWQAWQQSCAHSGVRFLQQWGEADRVIRSVIAAVKIADADGELVERVRTIIDEHNLVEREKRLSMLRWELSETYSEQHYFDITALLAYLVKVNIIASRMRLDPTQGRELLGRMVNELKM